MLWSIKNCINKTEQKYRQDANMYVIDKVHCSFELIL